MLNIISVQRFPVKYCFNCAFSLKVSKVNIKNICTCQKNLKNMRSVDFHSRIVHNTLFTRLVYIENCTEAMAKMLLCFMLFWGEKMIYASLLDEDNKSQISPSESIAVENMLINFITL